MVLEMRPWLFSQFGALRQWFKEIKGINSGTKVPSNLSLTWLWLRKQTETWIEMGLSKVNCAADTKAKGLLPHLLQGCLSDNTFALLMRSAEYTSQCEIIPKYGEMDSHILQMKKNRSYRLRQENQIKN